MKKGTGCGVFGLLILGAAGWVFYQARTPPKVGSVPLAQLSPTQQAARRAEAKQLETQVQEVARAGRNGEHKNFTLRFSSDQVNTLLQDRVDTRKFPIKNLQIGFAPQQLLAQGEAEVSGFSGVVTLTGEVTVQDGKLQFHAQSLQIGGLPAPSKWKEKLDAQISRKLNRALLDAPGRVDKVELQQDVMIVSGQTD